MGPLARRSPLQESLKDRKQIAVSKSIMLAGMKSLSRQFGAGLLNLGLNAGDKVAVLAPNCPEVTSLCFHFEALVPTYTLCTQ